MIAADLLTGSLEALKEPLIFGTAAGLASSLAVAAVTVFVMGRFGWIESTVRRELLLRCGTWAVLAALILGPIVLGKICVVIAVGLLSLGCYREYARATGLFRQRLVHVLVVAGIIGVALAAAFDRYHVFIALWPFAIGLIAAGSIALDRPQGYIQRTSLGVFGFLLFGACLGFVSLLANDGNFRLLLIWLLLAVELNDVFAFLTGKLVGGPRLRPRTSPNKTLAASIGAMILTTALVILVGLHVFEGQPVGTPGHLVALGLIISICGQLGDLVLSSIKRDLQIKDMSVALPGHGGLLDRFDSLILVAPVVFYYLAAFQGVGDLRPWHFVRMTAGD
ncbi:MAG: phosphatidate cytidylyltransferase [Phycisphaeraceae bacterium]|nr:phosphatidate cytidylyltransferase [Phycisphaeraceae bacterium]